MATRYYMLVSSLPHLPYFKKAGRLPINPQRLRWRRAALEPQDARDLELALDLLHWPRHALDQANEEIEVQYQAAMDRIRNRVVREFVDRMIGGRSILAGLRQRQLNRSATDERERCGVGRWGMLMRSHWDRDGFGLGSLYPWVTQAKTMLEQRQVAELDELQMSIDWHAATQMADLDPFAFPAVFAYVIKWDILSRWLNCDASKAAEVFTQMVDEVINAQ